MTNDIVTPALDLFGAPNNQPVIHIITCGPVWPYLIWWALIVIAPIISIIMCLRAWRLPRMGPCTAWTGRVILFMALLVISTTVVWVLSGMREVSEIATMPDGVLGASQEAMFAMSLSQYCFCLIYGVVSASICLLCALLRPIAKSEPVGS